MSYFHIEHREKIRRAAFFPDSIAKERHVWGQSTVRTSGWWNKYRLVVGNLPGLVNRINTVAAEYSAQRAKMEYHDALRLFEQAPQVRATGLEYYDYAGRIDTLSRESIVLQYNGGQRIALNRDKGVGFRGIVVRTEEPWSMEQYALSQLLRVRLQVLNFGNAAAVVPSRIGLAEPWRLRQAAERQLSHLLRLAWAEFIADPNSQEKLNSVIAVEKAVHDYICQTMDWLAHSHIWEHAKALPFPDQNTAIQLWEEDNILSLLYDETFPWWRDMPAEKVTQITAIRRAYITTGRVNITITTNPLISAYEHDTYDAAHHMLTYGEHLGVGVAQFQPDLGIAHNEPFIGARAATGRSGSQPWNGNLPMPPAWRVLMGEGAMPEPTMQVKSREVRIGARVAERLEAAMAMDKPTLVMESINGATAPILVLPRMFVKTNIVPLFGGGRQLRPIEEHASVEGWATHDTGVGGAFGGVFGPAPSGFLEGAATGRPMREGAIQEILPYA